MQQRDRDRAAFMDALGDGPLRPREIAARSGLPLHVVGVHIRWRLAKGDIEKAKGRYKAIPPASGV